MYKYNKEKNRQYHLKWWKKNGLSYARRLRREGKERKETMKNKLRAIKYKGGECEDCGFSDLSRWEVFDFDHLGEKNFPVSLRIRYKWETVKDELDLCDLVCANCHRSRTRDKRNKKFGNPLLSIDELEKYNG